MAMEMLQPRQPQPRPSQENMLRPDQYSDPVLASAQLSHNMDPADLECPMNWPLHRKLYTSLAAWLFVVAFVCGLTCYTAGLNEVVADFNFNPDNNPAFIPVAAISGFSVYLFGIFFAPIVTPHIVERIGRSIVYLTAAPLCAVFLLGAGFAQSFAAVAVLRFLAGLFGGPIIVNIEGTFADIWSAKTTNTYYAFQGTAQFIGAGLGPIIGGYLVEASGGWRWTQYFSAIFLGAVTVFGIGISESYQREIPRRRAKRQGRKLEQDPPLSGSTIGEIVKITVIDPVIQVFTDPIVAMSTFILLFNFAVVMQFIITVPVALGSPPPMGPGFSITQVGLAFTTVIAGAAVAALLNIMIEQVVTGMLSKRNIPNYATVEYRLIPSMIGVLLVTASLFWIGATVGNPSFPPVVPIIGSAVFVWGVAMNIFSIIPYLFDAFPPAGTLSALTAAATGRIAFAAALPLVILQFFTAVTPKWALFIFGFISIPIWAIPFVMFRYGPILREKSKYGGMIDAQHGHSKLPQEDEETGYNGNTGYAPLSHMPPAQDGREPLRVQAV